jgi:hypothetical protein
MRITAIGICVYSLSHYSENPPVIIIVAVLTFLFAVFIGDDTIIIYPDRIIQKTNSLISLYLPFPGVTYYFKEIKQAYLESRPDCSILETSIALTLSSLSENRNNSNTTTPIYFILVDGRTVHFDTELEINKIRKIVQLVNSLIPTKS